MKILVFSDSHGNPLNMAKAVQAHAGYVDAIIHLGDGIDDLESIKHDFPHILYYCVAGNKEENTLSLKKNKSLFLEKLEIIDDLRFFLCHGHMHDVKFNDYVLVSAASRADADIALFGHTHTAANYTVALPEKDRFIRLFNPGSIGMGPDPTFGYIETVNGYVISDIGHINKYDRWL